MRLAGLLVPRTLEVGGSAAAARFVNARDRGLPVWVTGSPRPSSAWWSVRLRGRRLPLIIDDDAEAVDPALLAQLLGTDETFVRAAWGDPTIPLRGDDAEDADGEDEDNEEGSPGDTPGRGAAP